MKTAQIGVCYGAIPFRALRDHLLSGLALRLLGIIAAHDRFGRNGRGCWAGIPRLAQLAHCTRGAAHAAVQELIGGECPKLGIERPGYISMEDIGRDEKDRRKRTYEFRVIYTDEDLVAFEARDTGSPAKSRRDKSMSSTEDVSANTSSTEDVSVETSDSPLKVHQDVDIAEKSRAGGMHRDRSSVEDVSQSMSSVEDISAPKNIGQPIENAQHYDSGGSANIFRETEDNIAEAPAFQQDERRLPQRSTGSTEGISTDGIKGPLGPALERLREGMEASG